jgi:hypothetical protein
VLGAAFAALVVLLTSGRALERLGWLARLPGPFGRLEEWAAPLASFNAYGLFQRMTLERPELSVEGSADGREWKPYRFRYKPLELERAPRYAGLHMPRLDWQMWFAALEHDSNWRSAWIGEFVRRLLEGSQTVSALLAEDPFRDSPPRFVRVQGSFFRFSTPAERRAGLWWQRSEPWPFLPVMERER